MPVTICWSEKERSSLRHIGAEVDLRRPSRMMTALRRSERKFVMMNESRVPAPATPASVGTVAGTAEQFPVLTTMTAVLNLENKQEKLDGYRKDVEIAGKQ